MARDLKGRSFLKLLDFEPEEIRYLLDLAEELKAEKYAGKEEPQLVGSHGGALPENRTLKHIIPVRAMPAPAEAAQNRLGF